MLTLAIERYDRVAATYSIEPRHPFLDRRFVQFCVSLPWDQKVAGGWTKIGLRRATAGLLPETVRFRKSWESLGPDFVAAQLHQYDPLVRLVFEERLSWLEPFVAIPKVSHAYRQYRRTGTTDGEWGELWTVLSLSIWLDRFGVADMVDSRKWHLNVSVRATPGLTAGHGRRSRIIRPSFVGSDSSGI